ncbi:23S rRNA (adenine(1618)-N(6))-methyltransferase RlmF [Shewanella sp. D64]|uniref:23S rRNA (adenine(1618)-N(6))-methyltransferase RlmF n=1 Tax=unclassified Shewanella TaxID=196818 RepID=UPI0022BA6EB4|nr:MULTISPECIES: 23S rRNA (adenine(1618)-N(6))-methyltransferase RlmF [unclassified Shewanella]MEC4726277.1 23S rRNA (adenine(1618)-N(6))-methyltransferase RlmF [Shewanella sp. D64]MEC4738289.1 23S rRNA (adenine(1618)-N(6))-methyltransferase RlmF [Shewanella sp. E94]WBJ95426.1 23S rRNA (adenine(1618)-N(6))-methyltransferase RlmF [Shewanella sp. MTB7]
MIKPNSTSSRKPNAKQDKNPKKRTNRANSGGNKGKAQVNLQKPGLHPRNLHRDGYDFDKLTEASPALTPYVKPNPYGNLSIDFADPLAVKALNSALLKLHYQIGTWDIPQGFLCPPIPGRVDYLHYIADLLVEADTVESKEDSKREGQYVAPVNTLQSKLNKMKINALDIGTGANGIYPILGIQAYGWRFVASDVDPLSLSNVNMIVAANVCLQGKLQTRLQTDHQKVFNGIIQANDRFDITLCNPPFHSSLAEASEGTQRKVKNLAANRAAKGHKPPGTQSVNSGAAQVAELNFGGQKAELWCDGGEKQFLDNMIRESKGFATQCLWFTSLVSKKENLQPAYSSLQKVGAATVKTIDMAQGNKLTRVLAWSFLTPSQRDLWAKYRS